MNIANFRSDTKRDFIKPVVRKIYLKIGINNHCLSSGISTMIQKLSNNHRIVHQLLSEETTKIKKKYQMSGGISLLLYSILIIIGANILNNITLLLISISLYDSLEIKGQSITIQ